MNHTEVYAALLILERRLPDRHITVDEAMAAAWHADLAPFPATVAVRAAHSWEELGFPTAPQFAAACRIEAKAITAEEQRAHAAGAPLQRCPVPCDNGWVETRPGSIGEVMPCSWCRPAAYAIWQHRGAVGHDEDHCADCLAIKRRKPPAWVAAAEPSRPVEVF